MNVSLILLLGAIGSCWAELQLLMSVFRHANRYPESRHVLKEINSQLPYDFSPNSRGKLTNKGKLQAFEFGKLLRERYVEWLGTIYSSDLVTFHSNSVGRCINTALLVAAGLFPPRGVQRWNDNLDWQPIPVQVYSLENTLFFGAFSCETYLKTLETTRSTDPVIVEYDNEMQDLYEYVSNHTEGRPASNRILSYLNSDFMAVVDLGLELPPWVKPLYDNGTFTQASVKEKLFSSWTDELKQWTGGVWIKEWLDHVNTYLAADDVPLEEHITQKPKAFRKKAFFYAGHDINIAGILITLGIYDHNVPDYTSAVNFELHNDDDGRFYVKILHKNIGNFTERTVPGCDSTLCPLNTFKDIFQNLIQLNATKECGRQIMP